METVTGMEQLTRKTSVKYIRTIVYLVFQFNLYFSAFTAPEKVKQLLLQLITF